MKESSSMAESSAPEMDLESKEKREREEEEEEDNVNNGTSSKKQKKMEKEEQKAEEEKEKEKEKKPSSPSAPLKLKLGHKDFASSLDMFHYFYNFLHAWSPFLNVNKYEHIMLLELLKNGYTEPDQKIGGGIRAFQVRKHPTWKSRCFFLIREDGSTDDFSFRKCVDHILPLPEEMQLKPDVNRALGGGGKHRAGKSGGGGRGVGGNGQSGGRS